MVTASMTKHSEQAAPHLIDAAAILILGTAIYGWIAWYDYTATAFTDSLDYLQIADFYRSLFFGSDVPNAAYYYTHSRFPPLFPLLIALVGGGSDHQHIAAILSNVLAVGAALATWWWIASETGHRRTAIAIASALLLLPHYFLLNLSPVSEPLGILLTSMAFALVASPVPKSDRILVAALLSGIAPLARSALLPLPIAMTIWIFQRRLLTTIQSCVALTLAWTPVLAWSLYRKVTGAQQYTGYLNAEQFAAAGYVWPDLLWRAPWRLIHAMAECFAPVPQPWAIGISIVLGVLAAAGCVLRIRAGKWDGWFLGGYVALILIWPFPEEDRRFVTAIYPCLLMSGYFALVTLRPVMRMRGADQLLPAAVATLALTTLSGIGQHAIRATTPVDPEVLGEKREPNFFSAPTATDATSIATIMAHARVMLTTARDVIPPGACLYVDPPQLGRMYAQRMSYQYPERRESLAEDRAALSNCDWFVVGAWGSSLSPQETTQLLTTMRGWTDLVLVSKASIGSHDVLASALFRRSSATAPGQPDRSAVSAKPDLRAGTR